MKSIVTNHNSAAIVGFIFALPFAVLLFIAGLNIEPFNGLIKTLFTRENGIGLNALGATVIIGALLLLPAAFIVNLMPIVHSVRVRNSMTTYPINLLLSIALLGFISIIVGGFIVDQYPCWMGVASCD